MWIPEPRRPPPTWLLLIALAASSLSSTAHGNPDEMPPAPGRMFVVGRVLDEKGNPVPGAEVMVCVRVPSRGAFPYQSRAVPFPIGEGRADGSGRFRIDAIRTASSQHEMFGAAALAPGRGIGWVELDPDDSQPTAKITLGPEQAIPGRLFDLQGQPVAGATVSVWTIRRTDAPATVSRNSLAAVIGRWPTDQSEDPAWPRPVKSDAEGRFTIRGLGRNQQVALVVKHPRFAHERIVVDTNASSAAKPVAASLVPSQILNVRVTAADTGKPIAHAPLVVMASRGRISLVDEAETDEMGRVRVNSYPADRFFNIFAYPPEGQPYLIARVHLAWPKGALEQPVDLAMSRGISIRGKVTEAGSGKPVAGAQVYFMARSEPRNGQSLIPVRHTGPDGSFQVPVFPGPGYLFVRSPDEDLVLQVIGSRMVDAGQPGGSRFYSHAIIALDPKPGAESLEVNPVVRRGKAVTLRVIDPEGQPARDAWIFSRILLGPRYPAWQEWGGNDHGRVRDGRFELRGLEDGAEVPVYLLDPKRKLGGTASPSAAGGPVTVRLEPCGTALARLVAPDGRPVVQPVRDLVFALIATPGPPRSRTARDGGLPFADEGRLATLDPVNHAAGPIPDAGGRITLSALIPGAIYRIVDNSAINRGANEPAIRKEFTLAPGQTVDLGDIRVEKPPQ